MKKPLWSMDISRLTARGIVAASMLLVIWAGFWLRGTFVAVGLTTLGTVIGAPISFIGFFMFLGALFGRRKTNTP